MYPYGNSGRQKVGILVIRIIPNPTVVAEISPEYDLLMPRASSAVHYVLIFYIFVTIHFLYQFEG